MKGGGEGFCGEKIREGGGGGGNFLLEEINRSGEEELIGGSNGDWG